MKFWAIPLGSAAMLACGSGASGADLLPIPEPVEHVRVCGAFGTGFLYVPGSSTCLSISGELLLESHIVDGDAALVFGGPSDSEFNNATSRARANLRLETYTATELGQIRTYVDLQATLGPDSFVANYEPDEFELSSAFIELTKGAATFTAGHRGSFFDFFSSNSYGTRVGIDDNTTEQTLFALTLASEAGLRGTLSIEDPASSGRRLGAGYAGQEFPDLVGSVAVERSWGSAQLMGALRDIHAPGGDGGGWAVGGGLSATLPFMEMIVSTQAAYSDGAIAYVTNDPGGLGDFSGTDGGDTNWAWSVRAGVVATLAPSLKGWLDGSFTHAETASGDDAYDFWAAAAGAGWEPAPGLSMGPEVEYNRIDGDDPGEDGEVWGAMWFVQTSF